jgi:hypothetical protein
MPAHAEAQAVNDIAELAVVSVLTGHVVVTRARDLALRRPRRCASKLGWHIFGLLKVPRARQHDRSSAYAHLRESNLFWVRVSVAPRLLPIVVTMPLIPREQRERRGRIELQLVGEKGTSRRHRELAAFVYYCVARIECELGDVGRWVVHVTPAVGGFTSTVAVENGSHTEVVANGFDGPLAIWDAMCRIEQALRDARGRRCLDLA